MPAINYIQLRAGTSAQWSGVNPVLLYGEPGLDTTLNRIKYGDGISNWSNLSWPGPNAISGLNINPYTVSASSGLFTDSSGAIQKALVSIYSTGNSTALLNIEGPSGVLFNVTNDIVNNTVFGINSFSGGTTIFRIATDDSITLGRSGSYTSSLGSLALGTGNPGSQKLLVIGDATFSGIINATTINVSQSLSAPAFSMNTGNITNLVSTNATINNITASQGTFNSITLGTGTLTADQLASVANIPTVTNLFLWANFR